jgi:class 3 adenylate cyclase
MNLSAVETAALVNEFLLGVKPLLNGGAAVVSLSGGGAMLTALWNEPDSAARCLEAALTARSRLADTAIACGIDTGAIQAAFVGASTRKEWTIYGDAADGAKCMADAVDSGNSETDILISENTRKLIEKDQKSVLEAGWQNIG